MTSNSIQNKKRRAERCKRRFNGTVDVGGKVLHGIFTFLSEYGCFFQTRHLFKTELPILVHLPINSQTCFELKGKIIPTQHIQPMATYNRSAGLGIEFVNPPQEFFAFIATIRQ